MSSSENPEREPSRLVVLHDGECSFCTGWVRRLARMDRHDRLRFLPLQSERGRALAARHEGIDADDPDTMIAVRNFENDDESIAVRSTAVLRIAADLPAPWSWGRIFRIVPRGLRDAVYRLIAKHRHKLPGDDVCVLNAPEVKRRMLA